MSLPLENNIQRMMSALQEHLRVLARNESLAVAYSGGLDSRFLSHAALLAGLRPILLHATGPHVASTETAFARTWAADRNLTLHEITVNPLSLPAVATGDRQRCYACKYALFSRMQEEAGSLPLCDGTHGSDSHGYRPGLTALTELGIFSPLAEVGLSKPDIRHLARLTGLERPDQAARPCLLTRLPYQAPPTADLLKILADAEQAVSRELRACLGALSDTPEATLFSEDSMPDFRVRLTNPACLELHMQPTSLPFPPSGKLFPRLLQAIRAELASRCEAYQLQAREMKNLSGYFDLEHGERILSESGNSFQA